MWKFWSFFHWKSLTPWCTQNIFFFFIVKSLKMHLHALFVVVKMRDRPLSNDDLEGLASCKWINYGATAVRGGIGDSLLGWKLSFSCVKSVSEHRCSFSWVQHTIKKVTKLTVFGIFCWGGEGYSAPKSLTLAPQDIPDISGYQLGFGCQCVKAYDGVNPVTNQKIL